MKHPTTLGLRATMFSLAGIALATIAAAAAQDSTPAPGNVGQAAYPRISPDGRVTFRIKAPQA